MWPKGRGRFLPPYLIRFRLIPTLKACGPFGILIRGFFVVKTLEYLWALSSPTLLPLSPFSEIKEALFASSPPIT